MMKIIIKYFPFCQISKSHGFRKQQTLGFPWCSVVKNLPAEAEDLVGSLVWEDPCAAEQLRPRTTMLSLCSKAQKLQLLNPCAATTEAQEPWTHVVQQEKPLQREAHAPLTRA